MCYQCNGYQIRRLGLNVGTSPSRGVNFKIKRRVAIIMIRMMASHGVTVPATRRSVNNIRTPTWL